ncbi:MAG TPA: thiolase family protein [Actinomycetales bacterium]|nr:thiolase family protein [Actinomycetales bacterium]
MSAFDDRTPVVVAARRTPIGTAGHGLSGLGVVDLLAPVLAEVFADLSKPGSALEPLDVDDVVVGNCRGPGGNVARIGALAAGLGTHVPGVTVDRQCGSGQEAVHAAAAQIRSGAAQVVLAGGVESGSQAAPGRAAFAPEWLGDPDMGPAAETVAQRCGISRERQDAFAARSHELALATAAAGGFEAELVPVGGLQGDERPRRLTPQLLARLPAAFVEGGSVTAGNSCGFSDGAAATAVVSERVRRDLGVPGLALRGWCAAGVDPATPGLGPVPAVRKLLARKDTELGGVDVIEIQEAFAAQVLAVADGLDLDPLDADDGRVNPQGGAIALGHPWGASGAMLVVRLFAHLVRGEAGRVGIATCAIGGGQGLALLAERVG